MVVFFSASLSSSSLRKATDGRTATDNRWTARDDHSGSNSEISSLILEDFVHRIESSLWWRRQRSLWSFASHLWAFIFFSKHPALFGAYIVVPLWPEGNPEGEVVQEILHWSRLTTEMMYKIIGQAIMDAGYEGLHPKDYQNFFCLANRELEGEGENYIPPSSPSPFSDYWNSQKNRRFTIYVHSKLMIGM
ncbi:Phospholipase D alpha 4 [Nymphaea thermarum]|nr:Phospholipase D alpha 4 [Nymphaea thermarum]